MSGDPEAVAARIYARRRPVSDPAAPGYLLPAREGVRIFREQIVPDLLAGQEPQQAPVVVFLVGQHGAGKSRTAAMAGEVLGRRGGFADLDSDLYKPYHPRYDELMTGDDTHMAAYLGPDSWAWLAQAHEYARLHKINVLKPETGQDCQGAAAHMRAYRAAGFRVEVMVMAVPDAMSNQGIISRYHEQVADRGHGRLTVQANADRAYTGILDLADLIDRECLADEVAVFRRGEAAPGYSNKLTAAGEWEGRPALRDGIESQRARPWTTEETADFLRTHAKLRRELGPRWTARLDEILRQAQPLMGHPTWAIESSSTPDQREERSAFQGSPAVAHAAPSTGRQPGPGWQSIAAADQPDFLRVLDRLAQEAEAEAEPEAEAGI